MRLYLKIFFFVSIITNVCFIILEIKYQKNQAWLDSIENIIGGEINGTNYTNGFNDFKRKAKLDNRLNEQKYYFINIWNTICIPCIKEMPLLDSIAGLNNKNISYFYVSDNSEKQTINCLNKHKISCKNFQYLNDMNDFISSIFNEKGSKNKIYPIQMIVDSNGAIKYYQEGAISSPEAIANLVEAIKKLN